LFSQMFTFLALGQARRRNRDAAAEAGFDAVANSRRLESQKY